MDKFFNDISLGLETAFIDRNINSNSFYQPEFLSNNYEQGRKVLVSLEKELLNCDEFSISVAFITRSGIEPLLLTLKELEKKNIKGRILTTDYLLFSDPSALDKLNELSNIELKMYKTSRESGGFHTKGYIFKQDEIYRIIIGSSNLTIDALTRNREWNTKLVTSSDGAILHEIKDEFEDLWQHPETKKYSEVAADYRISYFENKIKIKQEEIEKEKYFGKLVTPLVPNSMQVAFINNLEKIIQKGEDKALLISATGTGKTYASAFAMRDLGFKRVLFLVHRNQIVKQAKKSFERVFGNTRTMGIVSGESREFDKDYIFATIQTMSKEDIYSQYDKSYFDAIVFDEAHHTSASSYKRIMDYFKPKFTLGMTATPDKRDDQFAGKNIYELFNHQIAYEIRLQEALEEDLLCPFHYFGITDIAMHDSEATYTNIDDFRYLTSDERVTRVMEQARYYGHSGNRVKGLIFCSRVEEAKELSKKFNERGWRTIALSGANSEKERENAIDRLVMDTEVNDKGEGQLDYILSVDVFSEGVDIVEINQVIMLRPTESPIVFIQQLGRGLRKAKEKEFVVILDFIGNYTNNFMIPIALSGDRTYNKDNIRRYVLEGTRMIPGASTLHFDEISRKKIFKAIDNANFSDIKLIKENYINLKNKLGYIPRLIDFDRFGEMDVLRIFDNNSLGSYYKFLMKYEKEYTIRLNETEEKFIEFISKKLANGKRMLELEMINCTLIYRNHLFAKLKEILKEKYVHELTELEKISIKNILTNEFPTGSQAKTYEKCIFIEQEGDDFRITNEFDQLLENQAFKNMIQELIIFGLSRYQTQYSNTYQDTSLVLYKKYTYEDVCRLLNWEHGEVALNIGGYKYDKHTKTFPVFINYDKADDISATTKYEDHFINNATLVAISKSGRSTKSEDVQNFLHAYERGIKVPLFVRKNKDDKVSKEFYFLGYMNASGKTEEIIMPGTTKSAVEIEWTLKVPVREDIYEYIVKE